MSRAGDDKKPNKAKLHRRLEVALVWTFRILTGCTFIFSGITKTIDPWGFVYKITEYLNIWGIDWLWSEVVMTGAVTISIVEFCAGVLMLTGSLRRTVSWLILVIMAAMLPLSAYIAIADPVADCGCFGDALVISNTATFLKNVALTAMTVYLLRHNQRVAGIFAPLTQWMVIVASIIYALTVAIVGITIQPMVDFRQYKTGTPLLADTDAEVRLLYERGGETRAFGIDELPDSTWTYKGRETVHQGSSSSLAVFDGDTDVTGDVISEDAPQILLIVPDADRHKKARASMANNLNDYVTSHGGSMIGIIAAGADKLAEWKEIDKPDYAVYTSDDTTLKEIVRGDAGIVYLKDGLIQWKRNIFSLAGDFPDFTSPDNQLDSVAVVDSGQQFKHLTQLYMAVLAMILLLGMIRLKKTRKMPEPAAK